MNGCPLLNHLRRFGLGKLMIPDADLGDSTAVNFDCSVFEVNEAFFGAATKLKLGGLRIIFGRALLSEAIVDLAISHCLELSW